MIFFRHAKHARTLVRHHLTTLKHARHPGDRVGDDPFDDPFDDARSAAASLGDAAYRERMRGSVSHGLETCVSLVALVMDLAYPVVSRTVLQILRCRELGTAGFFLEAEHVPPIPTHHAFRFSSAFLLRPDMCAIAGVYCVRLPHPLF